MDNRLSIIALCLALFTISACVSKSKYMELETELNKSRALSVEDSKQIAVLKERSRILLDENRRLIEAVEDLKLELQQEILAVKTKERKISELDKTRKEIFFKPGALRVVTTSSSTRIISMNFALCRVPVINNAYYR